MSRFHLSIFSFNTLRLKTIPCSWWYSLLLALFAFTALEWSARKLMAPLGEYSWAYWDTTAMNKFEWYRKKSLRGETPEVVAIGDSTGARDFSPEDFIKKAGIKEAYNLAWPANFPIALKVSTFPLLEHGKPPKYVLLFQSPDAYINNPRVIRFEESILSSPLGQKQMGNCLTSDYFYLSRIYRARFLLIQHWIKRLKIVTAPLDMGFMPLNQQLNENIGPADSDTQNVDKQFSSERLNTIIELAKIARKMSFQLIVIVPPILTRSVPATFLKHRDWLEKNAVIWGYKIWDYSQTPFLSLEHFYNIMHLNYEGAKLFSSKLGERFRVLVTLKDEDFRENLQPKQYTK